jgi:hypothetical protein
LPPAAPANPRRGLRRLVFWRRARGSSSAALPQYASGTITTATADVLLPAGSRTLLLTDATAAAGAPVDSGSIVFAPAAGAAAAGPLQTTSGDDRGESVLLLHASETPSPPLAPTPAAGGPGAGRAAAGAASPASAGAAASRSAAAPASPGQPPRAASGAFASGFSRTQRALRPRRSPGAGGGAPASPQLQAAIAALSPPPRPLPPPPQSPLAAARGGWGAPCCAGFSAGITCCHPDPAKRGAAVTGEEPRLRMECSTHHSAWLHHVAHGNSCAPEALLAALAEGKSRVKRGRQGGGGQRCEPGGTSTGGSLQPVACPREGCRGSVAALTVFPAVGKPRDPIKLPVPLPAMAAAPGGSGSGGKGGGAQREARGRAYRDAAAAAAAAWDGAPDEELADAPAEGADDGGKAQPESCTVSSTSDVATKAEADAGIGLPNDSRLQLLRREPLQEPNSPSKPSPSKRGCGPGHTTAVGANSALAREYARALFKGP